VVNCPDVPEGSGCEAGFMAGPIPGHQSRTDGDLQAHWHPEPQKNIEHPTPNAPNNSMFGVRCF